MADDKNLQQLFKYDFWANKRIANPLQGQLFDHLKKCLNLLAHIRAAQQIWFTRIKGESTEDIELWPTNIYADDSIEQLQAMQDHWTTLIKTNREKLSQIISYQNSKGVKFNTPLQGILHHIIIHGQHHRAQIASMLRQSGIKPPPTDYIFYLREKDNE